MPKTEITISIEQLKFERWQVLASAIQSLMTRCGLPSDVKVTSSVGVMGDSGVRGLTLEVDVPDVDEAEPEEIAKPQVTIDPSPVVAHVEPVDKPEPTSGQDDEVEADAGDGVTDDETVDAVADDQPRSSQQPRQTDQTHNRGANTGNRRKGRRS